MFAGIVARLNQRRLAQGGAPMGLLNPWLYHQSAQQPAAFNAVAIGNNRCLEASGNGTLTCCPPGYGFNASAGRGWDPLGGLGTPDVGVMLALL